MVAVFKRKDLSSLNKFSFPVNGNYTDPFCESSKNLSSFFIQFHLFVANVRPDGKIKVCYTVYSIGGHVGFGGTWWGGNRDDHGQRVVSERGLVSS